MWPFNQNNQQMYQQYAQAYDNNNYNGIDNNQIWGHLLQFMRGAPMDMQQRIYQQHFDQMPYEQRVALAEQMPAGYTMDPNDPGSMAQSFHRLGQEQPNLLQRIMSHPLLTGAALGLVGLVAKHALSQHHQSTQQEQYSYQQQAPYAQQPQYSYNQGFQDPYAQQSQFGSQGYQQDANIQQQLYQEQQEVQELRRELREEQKHEERFEERERQPRRNEW